MDTGQTKIMRKNYATVNDIDPLGVNIINWLVPYPQLLHSTPNFLRSFFCDVTVWRKAIPVLRKTVMKLTSELGL